MSTQTPVKCPGSVSFIFCNFSCLHRSTSCRLRDGTLSISSNVSNTDRLADFPKSLLLHPYFTCHVPVCVPEAIARPP